MMKPIDRVDILDTLNPHQWLRVTAIRSQNLGVADPVMCSRLIEANFLNIKRFDPFIQFAITLQSKFVPGETRSILAWQIKQLKQQLHHVSNRVNQNIFKNYYVRKPEEYSMLMIPVIHGSAFSPFGTRTLHYHLAIGNIPSEFGTEEVNRLFKSAWKTVKASQDNVITKPTNQGWSTYIASEMNEGIVEYVDIDNMFVPSQIGMLLT